MSSRPPLFSSWLNSSYCAAIRILTFFSSVVILSEFCNLYHLKKGRCPVGRLPLRDVYKRQHLCCLHGGTSVQEPPCAGGHPELLCHAVCAGPVSYTHLDVYKRQRPGALTRPRSARATVRATTLSPPPGTSMWPAWATPTLSGCRWTAPARCRTPIWTPSSPSTTCLLYTSRCV